jgi:hypothetical protein
MACNRAMPVSRPMSVSANAIVLPLLPLHGERSRREFPPARLGALLVRSFG